MEYHHKTLADYIFDMEEKLCDHEFDENGWCLKCNMKKKE